MRHWRNVFGGNFGDSSDGFDDGGKLLGIVMSFFRSQIESSEARKVRNVIRRYCGHDPPS